MVNDRKPRFQVPVDKIFRLLVCILVFLLVANIAVIIIGYTTGHHSVYGILSLFRFNDEQNFPTYFSSVILLLSSVLLYIIFLAHKSNNLPYYKHWRMLSLVFLLLSIDEVVGLHELLWIVRLKELLGLEGMVYYAWVVPGIIICIIFAAGFFKFYLNLPYRYRVLFGISAFVFTLGFLGMEVVSGFFVPPPGEPSLIYDILTTIEELLEMIGITLFVYSLIAYIKSHVDSATLSFI